MRTQRYCAAEPWECRGCLQSRPDSDANYWKCSIGLDAPDIICSKKISISDARLNSEERKEQNEKAND